MPSGRGREWPLAWVIVWGGGCTPPPFPGTVVIGAAVARPRVGSYARGAAFERVGAAATPVTPLRAPYRGKHLRLAKQSSDKAPTLGVALFVVSFRGAFVVRLCGDLSQGGK